MRPSTVVLAALLLPVSAGAQTDADVGSRAVAVVPGSPVRVQVGTATAGSTEWKTGHALYWAADTLFLTTQAGDTMAVPQARTSGLMTLRGPKHKRRNSLLGGVIGGAIAAGIGAITFRPEYGRRASIGEAVGCTIAGMFRALGTECNIPVRQLNSKADQVAEWATVGATMGYLIGKAISHPTWEPLSSVRVAASLGPSGTGLRLSVPTR